MMFFFSESTTHTWNFRQFCSFRNTDRHTHTHAQFIFWADTCIHRMAWSHQPTKDGCGISTAFKNGQDNDCNLHQEQFDSFIFRTVLIQSTVGRGFGWMVRCVSRATFTNFPTALSPNIRAFAVFFRNFCFQRQTGFSQEQQFCVRKGEKTVESWLSFYL